MIFTLLGLLSVFTPSLAYKSGSGACTYDKVTMSRDKEQTAGTFTATVNATTYGPSSEIAVTVSGQHCGILAYGLASNGTEVGTLIAGADQKVSPFSGCSTAGSSLTHTSSYGSVTEASFTYVAPACDVGTVTLNIVVLSGELDAIAGQTFYLVTKEFTVAEGATFDCEEDVVPAPEDDGGDAATLGLSAAALVAGIVSAAAFA
uniref:Reelin domain-containing protein n=1 Tax=Sexangularia sp. CB-2014 TaxID=1486929 RepID=A0A7S1VH62_9EUKA